MDIIPVIDLMRGCVVHARRGERQHYQPIQSRLCTSSRPLDVVEALLELYPFKQLYIADLDAIQKRGHHQHIIADILNRHPGIQIWLDAGIGQIGDLTLWQTLDIDCIIASESLHGMDDYLALRDNCSERAILSLDFKMDGYQGPAALLNTPALWPDRVIAMTLARVGSDAGPAQQALMQIANVTDRKIYAAGGVRDIGDIAQLKKMGISGVLIASALHAGKLTAAEIETLVPS